jgi:dinuclear metal center YbgI/SA1388 family protein
MILSEFVEALELVAPLRHAESWDNVGLLVGDPAQRVARAMLTIDCTREVAEDAHARGCDVVVAYHPPIFAPLKRIAHDGALAYALRHELSLYSPHTALDAAIGGTNDVLANLVGLVDRRPIRPTDARDGTGMGRIGTLAPVDRRAFIERVRAGLGVDRLLVAGPDAGEARTCAVFAGSAGDFLSSAIAQGADVVVTGEVRHHDALAAAAKGVTVICALHSRSERVALEAYRTRIAEQAPSIELLVSALDRDPFAIV